MGKAACVDEKPVLQDEISIRSVEMGALDSADEFSLKITQDDTNQSGNTGASVAVKGIEQSGEFGKYEHLMRSGRMGKCNDPFCQTCPSYFGYSNQEALQEQRKPVSGSANQFRSKAASWSRSWIPPILNPHTKFMNQWNKIFCISSLIAVFIDPLFFFLFFVSEQDMCLVFNNYSAEVVPVVRTLTDTVYVLHIFLQFRLAYISTSDSKTRGANELVDDPKMIAIHYLKGWFLLDLFTALPLPQILIWTVVRGIGANYAKNVLRVVVLVQNVPRSIRFFPLLIGRTPTGFVFETAWGNFVINLLMYLLAGHIVGSCWYLFGLQRVNHCLETQCQIENNTTNGTFACDKDYLDCGALNDPKNRTNQAGYDLWKNYTSVGNNCFQASPQNAPQGSQFQYGIYLSGVPVVLKNSTLNKYIYAIFWGFQQISTLAGNQIPSIFISEVLFTMGICALGLLLFALLIGNMQNFLQALQRRKLEMQLNRYDTEAWMRTRKLPPLLRKRVKDASRFRWAATGGVEEQELLKDLPEDLRKDIQRHLCLDLVKKVELFKLLEGHVLDAICERLYQKLYIENSVIFAVKKPVERMVFIVRGQLESYGEDGSVETLKEGAFCGEELLSWYIDKTVVSTSKKLIEHCGKFPPSTRTVKCSSSVEAFSLDSEALEYITTQYSAAFRSPRVQGVIRYLSLFWRSQAAIRIQKAWRSHRERETQIGRERGAQTRDSSSTSTNVVHRITRFATMNSRQ